MPVANPPACLIRCIAEATQPTTRDLEVVAIRFWAEALADATGVSWNDLPMASREREVAQRAAVLAFWGDDA